MTMQQVIIKDTDWRDGLGVKLFNLQQMGQFCDVIIKTVEDARLLVHSCILAAASPLLKGVIESALNDSSLGTIMLSSDIDLATWNHMLEFMYMGSTSVEVNLLSSLSKGASILEIDTLVSKCGEVIVEKPAEIEQEPITEPPQESAEAELYPAIAQIKEDSEHGMDTEDYNIDVQEAPVTLDYIAVATNPTHSQNNTDEAYDCDLEELITSTPQANDPGVHTIKEESPSVLDTLAGKESMVADGSKLEYQELESVDGVKQYQCGLCGSICEDPVLHSQQHMDVVTTSNEEIVTGTVDIGIDSSVLSKQVSEVENIPEQQVIDIGVSMLEYRCHHSQCDKVYKSKAALKQHILTHHTEGTVHSCPKCCKTFKTEYLLKKHMSVTCSDSKPYSCGVCGKSFKLMAKLKYHEGIHATVKPFLCPVCAKPMASKAHLKVHMEVHSTGQYTCFCGKTFNRVRKYKEHYKLQHDPNNPYRCTICQKNLKNQQALEVHKLTHSRPFSCRVCKKGFLLEISCRLHEKKMHHMVHPDIVDVDDDRTCPICLKTFKNKKSTLEHMGVHTEGGEHKCHDCGKIFKLKKHLRSHIKQHLERNVPCPKCGKMFKHTKNLQLHLDTHNKPHACEECGARFASEKGLKKHYQSHTEGKTPNIYCCPHCGESFPSLSNAKLHVSEFHPSMPSLSIVPMRAESLTVISDGKVSFTCNICGESFENSELLDEHFLSHKSPYLCQVCGKGFLQLFACKFHEKNEHNVDIPDLGDLVDGRTCPVCGKIYKNKSSMLSHLSLHSDKGNHSCDVCGKVFQFKKNLVTHRTSHADRTVPCPKCDKKFKSERSLRVHLLSHSKPFECTVCGASFSLQKYLVNHQKSCGCVSDNGGKEFDSGKRHYNCTICTDVFHTEAQLSSHELKKHSTEKRLKCVQCSVLFISSRTLSKHMYTEHKLGELCKCTHCEREFHTANDLKLHSSVVHNINEDLPSSTATKNSFKSLLSDFVK